ncbi:hypothetical protein N7512_008136 [Penicillium capsulatum]|nr:hypothetical protein N7512_008136 [Penicillium capsulatum]
MHGYSLAKCLPLVIEDQGAGFVNDSRDTLAKGGGEYLDALTSWLEDLGLGYSAQISYNLPLDMQTNIDRVDAPECESLGFNDNIDGYRQFAGLADVAQKSVISNEMGFDQGKSLALSLS